MLFNNAGINPTDDSSVLETDARGLAAGPGRQRALGLPLLQARDPAPARDAGGGSVINTASFVAVMGAAVSQISYTASKGAVLALSRELGVEFARPRRSRQRALPRARSTRRCSRSCSPRTRRRPRSAWSTCRWAASASPRRSPRPRSSSPATSRRFVTATTFMVDGGLSGAYLTPGQATSQRRRRSATARSRGGDLEKAPAEPRPSRSSARSAPRLGRQRRSGSMPIATASGSVR